VAKTPPARLLEGCPEMQKDSEVTVRFIAIGLMGPEAEFFASRLMSPCSSTFYMSGPTGVTCAMDARGTGSLVTRVFPWCFVGATPPGRDGELLAARRSDYPVLSEHWSCDDRPPSRFLTGRTRQPFPRLGRLDGKLEVPLACEEAANYAWQRRRWSVHSECVSTTLTLVQSHVC